MERQVLLDKLSECLMAEEYGVQLFRVVASRSADAEMRRRFEELGQQTARHRSVLVDLIHRLGGDPSHVSPSARLAQVKAEKLIESALVSDGLSPEEVGASDLENVLVTATRSHALWSLLARIARETDDEALKQDMGNAVAPIEAEKDQLLAWAREALSRHSSEVILRGPAPDPERALRYLSGPEPPIERIHPAPVMEGLFPDAHASPWQEPLVVREVRAGV